MRRDPIQVCSLHNLLQLGEDIFVSWAAENMLGNGMMVVMEVPEEQRSKDTLWVSVDEQQSVWGIQRAVGFVEGERFKRKEKLCSAVLISWRMT